MPWPTVLHKYIADESDDIWSAVIERARSNPEEVSVQGAGYGQTALHAACYRYPPEHAIRVLIDACPDAAGVQNSDGETALHLALDGASDEVQMMLLEACPMAVSKVDKYGDSPLHIAAHSGSSTPLLRKMLQASPETSLLPNKRGATPFFLLSRSYEFIQSRDEIKEDGEYFDEWERVIMFLKASYFGTLETPKGKTFRALHAAGKIMCPINLTHVIARLFPEQAIQRDEDGCTPLALAASATVFEEPDIEGQDDFDHHYDDHNFTIQNNDFSHEYEEPDQFDGNGSNHNNSNAGLNDNLVVENGNQVHSGSLSSTFEMISPGAANFLNNQSTKMSLIDILVNLNPLAARICDSEGRLPFVRAIESGKLWNEGLRSLLWAAPQALSTRDMKTRMYPFMIAAVEHNATETTVYELIRLLPELVAIGIPQDDFIKNPVDAAVTNTDIMSKESTEKEKSQFEYSPTRRKKSHEGYKNTCSISSTEAKSKSEYSQQSICRGSNLTHPNEQGYKKRKRNLKQKSDEISLNPKRYENPQNYRPSAHVFS